MIDRKAILDAATAHGWSVSFGYDDKNTMHFAKWGRSRFLDIYLAMDDSRVLEAWCEQGRVDPTVPDLIRYLEGAA